MFNPPRLLVGQPFRVKTPNGVVQYRPTAANTGNPDWSKVTSEPYDEREGWGQAWAATFFIGLAVDGVPTWTPEQVRDEVLKLREHQLVEQFGEGYEHGGSVTPMVGFWTRTGEGGGDEQSVSVRIIASENEDAESVGSGIDGSFVRNMYELGRALIPILMQYSIILQIDQGGVVRDVYSINAKFED